MQTKGIIDRFEGDFAVIEVEGKTHDIKRDLLAKDAKAGDVVVLKDGIWHSDKSATKARSQKIKSLMDSVWED